MNSIKVNSTLNVLEIIDNAKKQRNSLYLVMGFNFANALIYSARLFTEEFSYIHAIWIFLGFIAILKVFFDFKSKSVSNNIVIDTIESYTYKKSFWNTSENIILQLIDGKKRYISIFSKNQLEEFEVLFQELKIPKHDKKKEINY